MISHAMLMAAGLGTRLRPFTDREPKALLPLMGVPMAQFALDSLAAAGVRRVTANIHHHAERARAGFLALDRGGIELNISDESDELLGSAGGLRKALPSFDRNPFFLVNADTLCDVDLRALAHQHERLRRRWGVWLTMTIFPVGPAGGKYREIFYDPATELVTGFSDPVPGRPYFASVAIMEPEALAQVPSSGPAEFLPTILEPAIRARRVGVFLANGSWFDVGSPSLWLGAHEGLIRGLETGKIASRWRSRIEGVNRRVGQELWVSREARVSQCSDWAGPAYWNPWGDSTATAPQKLGPGAVLYGRVPEGSAEPSAGVGFGGRWAGL